MKSLTVIKNKLKDSLPSSVLAFVRLFRRVVIGRVEEFIAYLVFKLRPTSSKPRILIFGQGRTGSSLLESLIASTGEVASYGEILNPKVLYIISPLKYLLGMSRMRNTGFICHVKWYHISKWRKHPLNLHDFLKSLEVDGWHIIYLHRNNILKQVLSGMYGVKAGRYGVFEETNDSFKLRIECSDIIQRINNHINMGQIEREALQGIEYVEVEYKSDLLNSNNHQRTADRIFNYIGSNGGDVSSKRHRSHKRKMEDYIENFDEFRQCLVDNDMEHFLNDEN